MPLLLIGFTLEANTLYSYPKGKFSYVFHIIILCINFLVSKIDLILVSYLFFFGRIQMIFDSSSNTKTQDNTTGLITEASNNNSRPRRNIRKPNYLQEYV